MEAKSWVDRVEIERNLVDFGYTLTTANYRI